MASPIGTIQKRKRVEDRVMDRRRETCTKNGGQEEEEREDEVFVLVRRVLGGRCEGFRIPSVHCGRSLIVIAMIYLSGRL
jgi:hypothetical protein